MISCEALQKCVKTFLLYACQSATVWLFIKQLVLGLAVARRHVRQLHMAGSGRSPNTGSKLAQQQRWGQLWARGRLYYGTSAPWNSLQNLDLLRWKSDTHFSVNTGTETCIYWRNYSDKHRLEVSHLSLHFASFLAQIKVIRNKQWQPRKPLF